MTQKNLVLTSAIIVGALSIAGTAIVVRQFSASQNKTNQLESDLEIKSGDPNFVLGSQTDSELQEATSAGSNNTTTSASATQNNTNPATSPTKTTSTNPTSTPTNINNLTQPTPMPEYKTLADFKKIDATQVTFKTTQGDIVLKLERELAPLTTANFLDLVDKKLYDGMVFHRVIPDFMAQVGDPLSKDPTKQALWGTGGPGYKIMDEFNENLRHNGSGVLSMANSGPNTGGSQIFITHVATPWLDGKHAVFGKVSAGLENLMKIKQGDKIISATYQ